MCSSTIETLRKVLYGQRLNLLIGSGASMPAIPLMNKFPDTVKGNADLLQEIISVSKQLLHKNKNNLSKDVNDTLNNYVVLLSSFINILTVSNSRVRPKNLNIFSTNYDLFVETAVDKLLSAGSDIIFNDGANGYFNRKLDSHNFDNSVSYRGQFENHTDEVPTIKLIKPHGSVNWKVTKDDKLYVYPTVQQRPFVVLPDGHEARQTFASNHFFDMLRSFQLELARADSVLIAVGFSFGDQHIAKLVRRALNSPSFMAFIVCYNHADRLKIENSLMLGQTNPSNLFFIEPCDLESVDADNNENDLNKVSTITLKEFSNLIVDISTEGM